MLFFVALTSLCCSLLLKRPKNSSKTLPGALLGRSGGSLGAVFGALGAVLGRVFERSDFRSIFRSILVPKRVAQGRHFGRQNGAKIEPKSIQNQGRNLRAKKLPLGVDLGRRGIVFPEKKRSRKHSVPPGNGKSTFLNERGVQERSGSEKLRKMAPKTTPKRHQNDIFPKTNSKTNLHAKKGRRGMPKV